jgi:hypothetical protein
MEMRFGNYIVKKEGKRFCAIYKEYVQPYFFITHRTNWKNACRVAKLLNQAYNDGKEDYQDDTWLSRY